VDNCPAAAIAINDANTKIPAWRMNPNTHWINASKNVKIPNSNTVAGFVRPESASSAACGWGLRRVR